MDDAYLNGYARLCGWQATLVYVSLCRHANKDQYCFPSIKLMSQELGVSRNTIIKGIKALGDWNITETSKQKRGKQGLWKSTSYTLIDKSEWKPKPNGVPVEDTVDGVPVVTRRSPCGGLDGVPVEDTKETHTEGNTGKETHIPKGMAKPDKRNKEVQSLIDELQMNIKVPLDGTQKENRRYAWLLIEKLRKVVRGKGHAESEALELGKKIIHAALNGWHEKNATGMKYIYYNMGKIIKEAQKNNSNVVKV